VSHEPIGLATLVAVPDPISEMSHRVFVTYLAIPGLLSDEEIAAKIRSDYVSADASEKLELAQAISRLKGLEPVMGPIRSAIRFTYGLPPIPGDDPPTSPDAP
jgi:hypothetical protein